MRKASWLPGAYSLAVAVTVITFSTGHLRLARCAALIPFLLLVIGITASPRRQGWVWAVTGVAATALMLGSLVSPAGDVAGEAGVALGTAALTAAMLGSGGWRTAMRHRRLLVAFVAVTGFLEISGAVAVVVNLRAALNPPPDCVDTCMGPGVAVLGGAFLLAEVLIVTLVVAAFANRALTGLGALTMAVGANTLFFLAPPVPTPQYASAIVAWFAGLLVLVLPWTRPTLDLGQSPAEVSTAPE